MKLVINQQLVADPVSVDELGRAFDNLGDEAVTIVLAKSETEFLQASGTPSRGFALSYQRARSPNLASANRAIKLTTLMRVYTAFARGEARWRGMVAWQTPGKPEWAKWFDMPPGLAALLIFVPITLIALWSSAQSDAPGTMPFHESAPRALIGIVLIAGFTQYADLFFRHVRPRLKQIVARALKVHIVESGPQVNLFGDGMSADQWEVTGKSSPGKTALVWLADIVVILIGIIGPVATFCIPAFLIAEWLGIK